MRRFILPSRHLGSPVPLSAPPPPRPAQIQPAPQPGTDWELRFLEAYDWGRPLPPAPKGLPVAPSRWLQDAASFDPAHPALANPFPPGPAHREVEALRSLLKAAPDQQAARLAALPLRQAGTALALWRWGQQRVRAGLLPAPLRRAWEDRLLGAGPLLTRGYALRHALCHALAEVDEARFAQLKAGAPAEDGPLLAGFQGLFGQLGGQPPELRLWQLPGTAYQDVRLDQLGAQRIWIRPAETGPLPELPADVAWIIPSAEGGLEARGASLSDSLRAEAEALGQRLAATGRTARFAPSREAFEALGLVWFPILIALDAEGRVAGIRMGDAAPARP